MELLDFLIATSLGIFATILLVYLVVQLGRPLLSLFGGLKQKNFVAKSEKRLAKVEELFLAEKNEQALKELKKSFVFTVPQKPEAVFQISRHNQNVLSRCLIAAEEQGVKAESIAEVEHLLTERKELLELYLQAKESFQSLRHRREKAGKKTPTWSKADFESRMSQISDELERNEKSSNEAVNRLFLSLKSAKTENIVYH